ncbi:NAD kinase [Coprobacter tertius]|uniref:NAD kinase n=1 Tax=Coprobacter tertius TaxID=2944915 RepID=A0ABT1MMS3_9BACT|nr:NAD kinase [Coprobacter tertius]MCP9612576.1 NAD kinase [Coprobacter tertius]
MKIAVFGNLYQAEKCAQARLLFETLEQYDAQVYICEDYYRFLHTVMKMEIRHEGLITSRCFEADMALSIGGDGTFLKTAERIGDKGIPILGINTGRLGFLADVSGNEIVEVMDEIFAGNYRVEERSLLQLNAEGLPSEFWPYALNEVAVLKRDSSSMISIRTMLDGQFLNNYQADGLVISTPTGSTAYSLSAGGPVLVPQASNFVISAVAPHSLNVRPLVITDDSEIGLNVESRSHNFLVSLDGRSTVLTNTQHLRIKKAPFTTKVVKRYNHIFIDTLRNKLMWGVDKRIG